MLLQYRDPDYPLRVREYLRVGARESPYLANNLRSSYWGDADVSYSLSCAIPSFYHTTNQFGDRTTQIGYGFSPQVAVRERRRFSAIVKEIQVRSFTRNFIPATGPLTMTSFRSHFCRQKKRREDLPILSFEMSSWSD